MALLVLEQRWLVLRLAVVRRDLVLVLPAGHQEFHGSLWLAEACNLCLLWIGRARDKGVSVDVCWTRSQLKGLRSYGFDHGRGTTHIHHMVLQAGEAICHGFVWTS